MFSPLVSPESEVVVKAPSWRLILGVASGSALGCCSPSGRVPFLSQAQGGHLMGMENGGRVGLTFSITSTCLVSLLQCC